MYLDLWNVIERLEGSNRRTEKAHEAFVRRTALAGTSTEGRQGARHRMATLLIQAGLRLEPAARRSLLRRASLGLEVPTTSR